jgi:hypothetical protein
MEAPFLDSPPVSYPCVYDGSYNYALLFTFIYAVSSLIEISLLWACPSKHGLPVEVNLPILFPRHSTYDPDDSTIILVWALALARLISYCESPHTRSLRVDDQDC